LTLNERSPSVVRSLSREFLSKREADARGEVTFGWKCMLLLE
jgi:hypothetical protein